METMERSELTSALPELERVPTKLLKKDMDCPICSMPFLEGEPEPSRLLF